MFKMPRMPLPPGRRLLVGALAVVALLALPAAATPVSKIVVFGSHQGSNLKLLKRGHKIVVKGNMAHHRPVGCHFKRGHHLAVCPTRGVGAIEVDMGPSGDFVRVARRLPVPLLVHLGFSEGSRRNRCIGNGGNDVCITGNRNSDCVGGPGNDYCHHGNGSDGCWGGPGRDICIMGRGQDGCHGGRGNDQLFGGPSPDQLYGGRGVDYCNGGLGIGKSHTCNRGPRH
jgi:hypothetical protein